MRKRHPLHYVYYNMKQRCLNKNRHDFKYYGGRGIKICDRWLESFSNFVDDMLPSYSPGLTLDRIEVNGDYAPENCRWVTMSVQCKNKRTYDNSPCGISGVSRHGDRWRARAYVDKKAISLGVYDTENEAIHAVKKFKEKE